MKLTDLDPHFIRHKVGKASRGHGRPRPDGTTQWGGFDVDVMEYVDSLAEAHGLWFDCPKCFIANGGPVGTHGVRIFFAGRGVPDHGTNGDVLGGNEAGQPVRWNVSGTGYHDLTTTPSILLQGGGCGWHGFITNGEILTC